MYLKNSHERSLKKATRGEPRIAFGERYAHMNGRLTIVPAGIFWPVLNCGFRRSMSSSLRS